MKIKAKIYNTQATRGKEMKLKINQHEQSVLGEEFVAGKRISHCLTILKIFRNHTAIN